MSELRPVTMGGRTVWIESDEVVPAPVASAPARVTVAPADANQPALTRTSSGGGATAPASVPGATELAQIGPTLEAVLEPIKASCLTLPGLSEVSVEVSLGFKGTVGFFVAKGEANGAVKVTAKWSPGKG
ncbi:CU044_2847 family protein [Roseateles sp. BYS78W]|uniref:CU044_2847 family protein n=1 Tax=Pelomonas candidula TaxID=3299025 RepID=A0ABW7HEU7_9BURK